MTPKEEIAALKAELEAKNAQIAAASNLRLKVSEKGAVSLYGIRARFPVTYYKSEWERILSHSSEIQKFLAANASQLSTKKKAA